MDQAKKRILVAMSGGVDSSVTAALLKEQGHEVIGMTMQLWDRAAFLEKHPQLRQSCGFHDAVHDARRVAELLDIPFHVVNFEQEFQLQVMDRFCDDYFSGRTPNPCVRCNQQIKFGTLLQQVDELRADALATGHYARIEPVGERLQLRKGVDGDKDQSYFLFTLTQQQLRRVSFPLGALSKSEVRAHALRLQLPVAEKSESQDICFIPDGDYIRFLEEQRGGGELSGDIVHISGKVLGRHLGTYRYTIGQRKGLGLAWSEPLYVVGIDAARRQVLVGEKEHLAVSELSLQEVNWAIEEPSQPLRTTCRIRYRHHEVPAVVTPLGEGRARVLFDAPQNGVTPGQAAVFYDADRVVGGGWIE